jgi:hypothetical protein
MKKQLLAMALLACTASAMYDTDALKLLAPLGFAINVLEKNPWGRQHVVGLASTGLVWWMSSCKENDPIYCLSAYAAGFLLARATRKVSKDVKDFYDSWKSESKTQETSTHA